MNIYLVYPDFNYGGEAAERLVIAETAASAVKHAFNDVAGAGAEDDPDVTPVPGTDHHIGDTHWCAFELSIPTVTEAQVIAWDSMERTFWSVEAGPL